MSRCWWGRPGGWYGWIMLGRSQMNVAPILGVLLVVFVGMWPTLRMQTIQIPRDLDEECECVENVVPPPRMRLHADGSIELKRPNGSAEHFEAPQVNAAVTSLVPDEPRDLQFVLYVQADDGVRWGDFVETVSSVSHITGGEVAIATDDE